MEMIEDKQQYQEIIQTETNHGPVVKTGLTILFIVFGLFGGWMAFAPLDNAAVASGKVTVEMNKKMIQHLEGGVVQEIFVQDGDKVKEGDLLLKISDIGIKSQLDTVKSEYLENRAKSDRLVAERDDLEKLVFSPEFEAVAEKITNTIRGQKSSFETRKKLRTNEREISAKQIKQLEEQIEGVKSVIKSNDSRIASIDEEISEWEKLYKEQLTDKIKLRELKREKVSLEGDNASRKANISQLKVKITELETQLIVKERSFKEDVLGKLQETQRVLTDLEGKRKSLTDMLKRTEVRSPVDGTVVGMQVHTLGGVIRPGEEIMSIVPETQDLIVDAKMQTTDIDKVHVGLEAMIRFSAFKLQLVHVVEGEVINVSADSFVDKQTGMPYYEVKVKVTKEGLKHLKENKFFLLPGMPAEVMIKTGERTLLSYLINPFTNMLSRAFKED